VEMLTPAELEVRMAHSPIAISLCLQATVLTSSKRHGRARGQARHGEETAPKSVQQCRVGSGAMQESQPMRISLPINTSKRIFQSYDWLIKILIKVLTTSNLDSLPRFPCCCVL
jgi:hypothetical protein